MQFAIDDLVLRGPDLSGALRLAGFVCLEDDFSGVFSGRQNADWLIG